MHSPIMTPKKKLIEVALPLDQINKESIREKALRHGHPSTLHRWWARRPLATCRAVLFAQLVDDPSSHPDRFPTQEAVEAERKRLFEIIEEIVVWENTLSEEVLSRARAEIRTSCGEDLPSIYDPFSGGGSISLEAQRLGLPARGSDLNPVAVMIGKAMIEIPPRFKDRPPVHPGLKKLNHYRNTAGLAEDVTYYSAWIRDQAFERIGHLYPQIDLSNGYGGKATIIAWLWARTVPSPDPAFSVVQVPLVHSFDLSTKKGKEVWVEPIIEGKGYRFEIRSKANGDTRPDRKGTVDKQGGGQCILSQAAMPFSYLREQSRAGNMRYRLMAIVAKGDLGRVYLPPHRPPRDDRTQHPPTRDSGSRSA